MAAKGRRGGGGRSRGDSGGGGRRQGMDRPPGDERDPLELVSYGRRGPGPRPFLKLEEVQQAKRTAQRVPEVVVKVSGGGREMAGVAAHINYIDRHGKLDVEMDDGTKLSGKDAGERLADEWHLDLVPVKPAPEEGEKDNRRKLVHNIVLSMPGKTPPDKLLEAARTFAREQFALQYRYAMVLHTDQDHPHVHLVVNATHETEPGKRLYIRKATLREWREEFAQALRAEGVAANATPAAQRGYPAATWKRDAIVHAQRTYEAFQQLPEDQRAGRTEPEGSTVLRARAEAVARDIQAGRLTPEPSREQLVATRRAVVAEWIATAKQLAAQGEHAVAADVVRFVEQMPPVRTDRERIAESMLAMRSQVRSQQQGSGGPERERQGPEQRPDQARAAERAVQVPVSEPTPARREDGPTLPDGGPAR